MDVHLKIKQLHKKDLFLEFAEIVKREGILTLKEVSKSLNIANLTAFDWRHKCLSSVPKITKTYNYNIFCKDFRVNFSQKGRKGVRENVVPIKFMSYSDLSNFSQIISYLDGKFICNRIATVGPLKNEHIKRVLYDKIKSVKNIYYLVENDLQMKEIQSKKIKIIDLSKYHDGNKINKKTNRISKINNELKIWVGLKMNGVATKYLQLYSNYFCYRQIYNFNPIGRLSLNLRYVWSLFTKMEYFYKNFITNHTIKDYILPTKRKWKTSFNYSLAGSEIPY